MTGPKKLISEKEYRNCGMYTCPYCKIVGTPLSFECNDSWCKTGYKCNICHEDVLPNFRMVSKK
jgi:hypothetical protein